MTRVTSQASLGLSFSPVLLLKASLFLRSFGKLQARGRRAKISHLRTLVQRFALAAEREAADVNLFYSLEAARHQLEDYEVEDAKRWKVRAGARWAADGDRPTAFFFSQFKERCLAHAIEGLKTPSGEVVHSPDELQDILVTTFESLYSSDLPEDWDAKWNEAREYCTEKVTPAQREVLDEDITEEEILQALQAMPRGKMSRHGWLPGRIFSRHLGQLRPCS